MNKIALFIILVTFDALYGIDLSEICLIRSSVKCQGKFWFRCGQNKCTSSRETCALLYNIVKNPKDSKITSQDLKIIFTNDYLNSQNITLTKEFYSNQLNKILKPCKKETDLVNYVYNTNHYCLRTKSCVISDYSAYNRLPTDPVLFGIFGTQEYKSLRLIMCPCKQEFAFQCTERLCAKSRVACDYFRKNLFLKKKTKIKDCVYKMYPG